MVDRATTLELAERFTRAIAENDAAAMGEIYAPDAAIWHCTDEVELTVPQLQGLLQAIADIATADVKVNSVSPTEDGFVQTQENTYTFKAGGSTRFHAALVVSLDTEGRISRAEEYLDSAGLNPLIQALEAG
jgi:ketosteroid isomerase-like protein